MHQLLVLGLTLVTFPGDGNVTMVKPPALEEGATIGIVAPASSLDEANVQRAIRNIQRRGYRVKLSLGYRQRQGYLAADDTVRAGELNSFFADPEVDAILCLRGGYGSPRILDQVDYDLARRNPKILIGYSDITALLLALHRRSGLVTFHGPMANNFAAGKGLTPYTEKWYWPAFRAGSTGFKKWGGKGPRGSGAMATMVTGRADGILVGGNLSVLVSTLGTPYEIDARDGILFLEDVNEKAFRIDRMLNQLRLGGKLAQLRGVILGSFTDCGSDLRGDSRSLEDLFVEYFASLGVPVVTGFPTGHVPDQAVMPIVVRVRLDAHAGLLTILEPPVTESATTAE